MGRPLLRLVCPRARDNLGTILFIRDAVPDAGRDAGATHADRSYLLGVAVKLATAWVVIVLPSMIRNSSSTAWWR